MQGLDELSHALRGVEYHPADTNLLLDAAAMIRDKRTEYLSRAGLWLAAEKARKSSGKLSLALYDRRHKGGERVRLKGHQSPLGLFLMSKGSTLCVDFIATDILTWLESPHSLGPLPKLKEVTP